MRIIQGWKAKISSKRGFAVPVLHEGLARIYLIVRTQVDVLLGPQDAETCGVYVHV